MEELENKKHTVLINDQLFNDIKDYCSLNNLKIGDFVNSILKRALLVEKFGTTPFADFNRERDNLSKFVEEQKHDVKTTSVQFEVLDIQEETGQNIQTPVSQKVEKQVVVTENKQEKRKTKRKL